MFQGNGNNNGNISQCLGNSNSNCTCNKQRVHLWTVEEFLVLQGNVFGQKGADLLILFLINS